MKQLGEETDPSHLCNYIVSYLSIYISWAAPLNTIQLYLWTDMVLAAFLKHSGKSLIKWSSCGRTEMIWKLSMPVLQYSSVRSCTRSYAPARLLWAGVYSSISKSAAIRAYSTFRSFLFFTAAPLDQALSRLLHSE